MTREQIAVELLRNCPAEATNDHINIALAIRSGHTPEAILSMDEVDRWPETYTWLNTELGSITPEPPKTTPGPWKVNTAGGMTYVENFYGQSICRVSTSNADANQIAAAPDLLSALVACLEVVDRSKATDTTAALAHIAARAAIAKAKGEA